MMSCARIARLKKVTSSAKDGETVVISENELDIPWLKKGDQSHWL